MLEKYKQLFKTAIAGNPAGRSGLKTAKERLMDLTADICRLIYLLMEDPGRKKRSRPPKTTANDRPRNSRRKLYHLADYRYKPQAKAVADVNMEE